MLPITNFLPCTDPLDEFDSLSHHQTQHAKTYVTGLAAASSNTITGIAQEVLPAGSDRALNKFITEYDWDEDELSHERLEELQNHGDTRWSTDGLHCHQRFSTPVNWEGTSRCWIVLRSQRGRTCLGSGSRLCVLY